MRTNHSTKVMAFLISLSVIARVVSSQNSCNIPGCLRCSSQGGCSLCDGSLGYALDKSTCVKSTLANCAFILSENECGICHQGFYLGRDSKCYTMPARPLENCAVYQTSVTCKWCETEYYLTLKGTCAAVKVRIPNCRFYMNSANCAVCNAGYALNKVDYTCSVLPPVSNCLFYSFPKSCKSCTDKYSFNPNLIVNHIGALFTSFALQKRQMLNGYREAVFNCPFCERKKGINFCIEYELANLCKKCATGFYLTESKTCKMNPVSYLTLRDEVSPNCISFNSDNICQLCLDMFYFSISDSSCKPHTKRIENCYKMSQNTKDLCLVCKPGFYRSAVANGLNGSLCEERKNQVAYCEEYSLDKDQCANCYFGMVLHNNGLVCTKSLANCLTHDVNSMTLSCLACLPGHVLVEGKCSYNETNCALVTQGKCSRCRQGYLLATDFTCQIENAFATSHFCAKYEAIAATSPVRCDLCPNNSVKATKKIECQPSLIPNKCLKYTKSGVCNECGANARFDSNGNCVVDQSDTCEFYDEVSTTKCLKCKQGYFLSLTNTCLSITQVTGYSPSGKCLSKSSSTNCDYCAPGYFVRIVNQINVASSCKTNTNTNCLTFNESTGKCELCRSGFYLDKSTATYSCVASCPDNYMKDPVTNACESKSAVVAKENSFTACGLGHGAACYECKSGVPVYDFSSRAVFQKFLSTRVVKDSEFRKQAFVGVSRCEDASGTETSKFIDLKGGLAPLKLGNTHYYYVDNATNSVYSSPMVLDVLNCNLAITNINLPSKFEHYRYLLSCFECSSSLTATLTNFEKTNANFPPSEFNAISAQADQWNTIPQFICSAYTVKPNCAVQEYNPYLEIYVCVLCKPKYKPVYTSGVVSSCSPINNCSQSNKYSECENCTAGYAFPYSQITSSPDYTSCISITDTNCKVYSTVLSSCIECSGNRIVANGVCATNPSLPSDCSSGYGTSKCSVCTDASNVVSYGGPTTIENQCDRLYLLDSTTRSKNCAIYQTDASGNYSCVVCPPSRVLFKGNCVSKSILIGCSKFDTSGVSLACAVCQRGYTLSQTFCIKNGNSAAAITGCDVLLKDKSCALCKPGYYLVTDYNPDLKENVNYCVLAALPPGCSSINKIEFQNNKLIFCDICQPGNNIATISSGSEDSMCVQFEPIANCKIQSRNTCIECYQHYFLSENVCVLRNNMPVGCLSFIANHDMCNAMLQNQTPNDLEPDFISQNNQKILDDIDLKVLSEWPPERSGFGLGIYKCVTYKNDSLCLECESGFYLKDNKCLRVSNTIQNCKVYRTETSCLKCQAGYFLEGDKCTQVTVTTCEEYSSPSTCKSCPSEYPAFDPVKSMCSRPLNDPFCQTFTQDTAKKWKCQVCADYYYPDDGGKCIAVPFQIANCPKYATATKCAQCDDGYYWDTKTKACVLIDGFETNCAELVDTFSCSFCQFGFYLKNGVCVKCETGDSCAICNSNLPSQCLICNEGYYMNDSEICKKSS